MVCFSRVLVDFLVPYLEPKGASLLKQSGSKTLHMSHVVTRNSQ